MDVPGKLNGLDVFAGSGARTLALAPWVRPRAYCEKDKYASAVLLARMRDGTIPVAPVWDDIRTLRGSYLPPIDIIYGGFPCQDLSIAGDGAGLDGKRSGLVFELFRLARECSARWIYLENVPVLSVRGLDRLLLELNAMGYDARWTVVSAAEMGAPHLRERIWILAHAHGERRRNESDGLAGRSDPPEPWIHGKAPADPNSSRELQSEGRVEEFGRWTGDGREAIYSDPVREGRKRWVDASAQWEALRIGSGSGSGSGEWPEWLPKPAIQRGDDGMAHRNEQIAVIGNGVVPQADREAFQRLMGIK